MPRRRFGMAAVSYGAMDQVTGPGIAPLALAPVPAPDRAADPPGFMVATDAGIRIHFLDWSAGFGSAPRTPGTPGVLLVHGLVATAWSWTPVARRLRHAARVAAMDLRGHGLSDAPTGGYEPDPLADDAIAVAEGCGILDPPEVAPPEPFVVAGIGYGAIVAAWAAHALGDRCAGLVLVDGGWESLDATTGSTPGEWLAAIEEPPEVLSSMDAWLADRAGFDMATWNPDEEAAARAQVVETAAGRVKLAVHPHALAASVGAMWTYDPTAVLPTVEGDIAALVARDDPERSRLDALREVAARRRAAGRSAIRAGAFPARGHNLVRYEPDAVAGAILAVASSAVAVP